ncbi:MAG TPA: biotin transporter BioY [Pyrinomonadaceae bacterium]|jgi:biotin transport system substrate-specific component
MNTYAKAETLTGAWLAPVDWVKSIVLVVAFSLLIALSAQVVVPLPFTPIHITLQTFAVLLTGALLGSRLGALALAAYLVEGASGLPFFSGGNGGWLYLVFSPTAGYLLAFLPAAFVTGWLAERGWDRKFLSAAAAIALGSIVILFGGWLGLLRFYPAGQAFALGVVPFVVGDIVKIALAAAALPSGWALLRRKR